MKMPSEWTDRLRHWTATLEKDFYRPLGDLALEGFAAREHLTPEAARAGNFVPMPEGTAWGREWEYLWLRGEVVLPPEAEGRRIVLNLDPGGESTLFVNGRAFGAYRAGWVSVPHHFYEDNVLTGRGRAGERFSLLCEAYAGHYFPQSDINYCATGPVLPGDYADPLAGGLRARLGRCTFGVWNEDAYQLWMDVRALTETMECLPQSSLRAAKLARVLQEFTLAVDFEQPEAERIADYRRARALLRPALECENGSTAPTFYGVGNAHLDVVWLWPLAETERKVARTFAAQLRLLEQYPGYRFLQSQPQLYAICQRHYPELFERVREAIRRGGWIAEGAMWVEPDTNMPSGESLVRQLVHGLRYYREELGVDCEILWLPDTFGYTAALPQLLKSCGIKYLVTQKIFWSYNEGERFPYHYFTWRGMDGSEVVSYLPTNYTYTTNPAQLAEVWENRVQRDGMDKFLLPFGYGDGGGGPSRDYIEYALREENLEGCPRLKLAHPKELFEALEAEGGPENTYAGELYFTAHRGVYTSQAQVKWGNRKAEIALREGELWGAVAMAEGFQYPYGEMDAAWKKVLLNQFHDILPGSSIARVYREAMELHQQAIAAGRGLAERAAGAIAGPGAGWTAFNSLPWERNAVVRLPDGYARVRIPSCGCAPVERAAPEPGGEARVQVTGTRAVLENGLVRAEFDGSGELVSFVLKQSGREFADGAMNRFLLYKDVPRSFDAWDIDSMYERQLVESGHGAQVRLEESDPFRCTLRITKRIGNSSIDQRVSLDAGSIRLEFDTAVEWRELHRLLKVSFPVRVRAEEGINEMQYGYVRRPAHRSRPYDKDRFEVCNHRYTALCDEGHGAAVLNDCKYGVSMLDNAIGLTLLRAAGSPELAADNGAHRFTYAFTAWEGPFLESPAVRQGYELNTPVLLVPGAAEVHSFFTVEGADNVVLEAVKPAEDGGGDLILRLYESKRADCRCTLRWTVPARRATLCNLLEEPLEDGGLAMEDGAARLSFRPFEVKTVRLKLGGR